MSFKTTFYMVVTTNSYIEIGHVLVLEISLMRNIWAKLFKKGQSKIVEDSL